MIEQNTSVLNVAGKFGVETEAIAKTYKKTRDWATLKEIMSFSADALGIVMGIHFVYDYLKKHRDARKTDAALDVSGLPIGDRKTAERIIEEVKTEMALRGW